MELDVKGIFLNFRGRGGLGKKAVLKGAQAGLVPRPQVGMVYQPTYRESSYQRPLFKRLTPLAWFMIALGAIAVIGCASLLLGQLSNVGNGTQTLPDRLHVTKAPRIVAGMTPVVKFAPGVAVPEATAASTAAKVFPQDQAAGGAANTSNAPAAADNTAAARTPAGTPSPATWAKELMKQPDGTLLAPQYVTANAAADLGALYRLQRDMPLQDYLTKRDELLTTYFTGAALAEMRQIEASRDLYPMNRAGRFTIEVRSFSPDGLTAKVGVIKRDWVSDIYDVASGQIVAQGKVYRDTLTVATVQYDQASARWKYAKVEEVVELQQ